MIDDTYYITTPIYYVNDVPHIGTAYCTVAADVQARFQRLLGKEVFFLTGTDENATKVAQAARDAGKEPQEFCDELAERFNEVWRVYNISHDDFIRTTEERHTRTVRAFTSQLYKSGSIYSDFYEGWYCVFEETFYSEEELAEGKCPLCGRDVEWVKEPSFYFRLSKYQEKLLDYFAESGMLQPSFRANEVISFTRGGLRDVAISRQTDWGIPLPDAIPNGQGHVVYVWFDALINYLSGIGFGSDDDAERARFERYWPPDVHLVGKDIYTRFHATLWPAMLMAAGLAPPRTVFAHGFWNIEGRKMSKSIGNVIEPVSLAKELAERAGCSVDVAVDAIRYFMFREVTFGQDGDFQRANLHKRFNGDLANDLGNLFNRVLTMVARHLEGVVPPLGDGSGELRGRVHDVGESVAEHMAQFDFTQALLEIWEFVRAGNRFVDAQAPWRLVREGNVERLTVVLRELLDCLRAVTIFVTPFMPTVAAEMASQLGAVELYKTWRWASASDGEALPQGLEIGTMRPIFPRLEETVSEELIPTITEEEGGLTMDNISFQDFQKLDLRVVKCVTCEKVSGADRLYAVDVDLGDETRTVVAGLAQEFEPEELIGKQFVLVANIEPAKIRGVASQGMILAAGGQTPIGLVTLDRDVPLGTVVK